MFQKVDRRQKERKKKKTICLHPLVTAFSNPSSSPLQAPDDGSDVEAEEGIQRCHDINNTTTHGESAFSRT
jgi:hypothetical protein